MEGQYATMTSDKLALGLTEEQKAQLKVALDSRTTPRAWDKDNGAQENPSTKKWQRQGRQDSTQLPRWARSTPSTPSATPSTAAEREGLDILTPSSAQKWGGYEILRPDEEPSLQALRTNAVTDQQDQDIRARSLKAAATN